MRSNRLLRQGLGRLAARALTLLTLALALLAMPAAADPLQRAYNAGLASSDRLRLRSFGLALEAGVLGRPEQRYMLSDLLAQGYGVTRGSPQITATRVSFAPVLAWDGNVNGGVLQDRLDLGWIVLEADPDYRAKSGLVLGGSLGAMGRLAWDQGRLFELTAATELAWSPRHEIGRADAMLRLCSRNHLRNWIFLDLCAIGARSWRELNIGDSHRLSAELSKVLELGEGVHELAMRYESASTSDGNQDRIALSAQSVWNWGVTDLALTIGAPQGEATVLRQRLELGYGWRALQRDWRIDLWGQRADGGMFLGTDRSDRMQGAGLAVSITPQVSVRLGVLSSRSTAAIADYDQVTLDLKLGNLLR